MRSETKKNLQERLLTSLFFVCTLMIGADMCSLQSREELSYGEFLSAVDGSQVQQVTIGPSHVWGVLSSGDTFLTRRLTDASLVSRLQAAEVKYGAVPQWRSGLYGVFFPGLALLGIGFLLAKHQANPLRGFGSRSRTLLISRPEVSFDAVAGCEEARAELLEVVQFMTAPERFRAMGADLPKGILLTGPPGTGKTLLARALAGEAGVPFFSLSGSDFVEMYVGVGAARVRGLFREARSQAPCVVFVDEIDALGKRRGSDSNDEREATLNQLLVELDGFDQDSRVLLVAATNRPDVIDPALLRPGRFDRQIVVDAPDRAGRLAILKVHAKGKKLCPDVSLSRLAAATPGMVGADLANLLNEAALLAGGCGQECISQMHLREAAEKVLAGPVRSSRLLSEEVKRRVAFHEAGHALVAHYSRTADPVEKISIVPRGKAALGYTLQRPAQDSYLFTETELKDRIRVLLGGRAAEQLAFGEVSTGAENDLERSSDLARRMAAHFGMGDSTGLLHAGKESGRWSPRMANLVDEQARQILWALFDEVVATLESHRDQLELVAAELYQREAMEASEFEELVDG